MAAARLTGLRTLRTHEWDGPAPCTGAVVLAAWRVVNAVSGAGVGHYALDVVPCSPDDARDAAQVIHWTEDI